MHNVMYSTYPEDIDKKEVQSYWDNYAAHEDWQEGCGGLAKTIRWINCVCDSYEDAERFIKSHDGGWYDQLAVKYRGAVKNRVDDIGKEIRTQRVVLSHLEQDFYFKGHKSQFKGCRKCGSSLNLSYLEKHGWNACPVCGEDLRPEAHKKKIATAKAKLNALEKKLEAEKKTKRRVGTEIRWLVKIEYHT